MIYDRTETKCPCCDKPVIQSDKECPNCRVYLMATENKTCKDCADFERCKMWNYSFDPCPWFKDGGEDNGN